MENTNKFIGVYPWMFNYDFNHKAGNTSRPEQELYVFAGIFGLMKYNHGAYGWSGSISDFANYLQMKPEDCFECVVDLLNKEYICVEMLSDERTSKNQKISVNKELFKEYLDFKPEVIKITDERAIQYY